MKFVDEYRDGETTQLVVAAIKNMLTRSWTVMEICGGQTHAIVRFGIDQLLPPEITLVHGPGCPVCVTPVGMIDKAIEIASQANVILVSFGDMARVPGTAGSLFTAKAKGADIRLVYSPMDALKLARRHPDREVIFFAVGFETTAPATAMAAYQAKREGLGNFSLLVAHVRVPPAMAAILGSPGNLVQGFLAAGHVCTVMGESEYLEIASRYRVPIVITGFEPLDILQGVHRCIRQLEAGEHQVENCYTRSVRAAGNETAQAMMREVFQIVPRSWRGVGEVAESGLGLAPDYADFDAERRFGRAQRLCDAPGPCISGAILQGLKKPHECPAFGASCTPDRPLGATMVSSEGACAAYYRYRRRQYVGEAATPSAATP
jgi:hydrogenase expression/formation protein HypD